MNKNLAYVLIVILLLIVLSLISMMGAVIKNGGLIFYSGDYKDIIKEEVYTLDSIENISLNLKSSDVEFLISDTNELKIIQYGGKKSKEYNEAVNNKSIKIVDNPINFMFFNFGNNSRYEVYLPNSYAGDLLVNTVSGEITIDDFDLNMKEIEIESVSGDIRLNSKIVASEAKVKTVSGEISIKQISSDKMELGTTSGDIEVNNIVSDNLNISTVSGEVSIDYVSNMAKINTTSGDVTINDALITEDSRISTVSGEVSVSMNKKSNCIIKTDTLSGDTDIRDNNYDNGEYEFKIETTSGNIEID